jgi:hypothetical protein
MLGVLFLDLSRSLTIATNACYIARDIGRAFAIWSDFNYENTMRRDGTMLSKIYTPTATGPKDITVLPNPITTGEWSLV